MRCSKCGSREITIDEIGFKDEPGNPLVERCLDCGYIDYDRDPEDIDDDFDDFDDDDQEFF